MRIAFLSILFYASTIILCVSVVAGCGQADPVQKCQNAFLSVDLKSGQQQMDCFQLKSTVIDGKVSYEYVINGTLESFTVDYINNQAYLSSGHDLSEEERELEFLPIIQHGINANGLSAQKFVSRTLAKDGDSYYYFSEGIGLVYKRSTTWFASMKLLRLEGRSDQDVEALIELIHLTEERDCMK